MRKYSIAIYQWDHQTGRFITNPYKPAHWKDSDLSYATAFSDTKGNILLSYRNNKNVPGATLQDPRNPRWMLEWDPETIIMGAFITLSYLQNHWALIRSESDYQNLQHFISHSPWDWQGVMGEVSRQMAASFALLPQEEPCGLVLDVGEGLGVYLCDPEPYLPVKEEGRGRTPTMKVKPSACNSLFQKSWMAQK